MLNRVLLERIVAIVVAGVAFFLLYTYNVNSLWTLVLFCLSLPGLVAIIYGAWCMVRRF